MTDRHQQPNWISQFPSANVSWLTDIVCRHARAVHAVLSHQAAVAAQAVHNVTEFEDLDAAHNASNPPLVIPPLPDDATTMDIIRYAALCVWRKPGLPPVQEYAVHKLVYDPL